jgi:hypothetical protein
MGCEKSPPGRPMTGKLICEHIHSQHSQGAYRLNPLTQDIPCEKSSFDQLCYSESAMLSMIDDERGGLIDWEDKFKFHSLLNQKSLFCVNTGFTCLAKTFPSV